MVLLGLAVAIVVGLAALALPGGDELDATAIPAPGVTLSYFDGSTGTLDDLRGRPVVLNFWASWCPACIGEMPAFGNAHRRLDDRVEFIGVNMQEVDLGAAMELVDVTRVEYRLVHDPNGNIFRQFGGLAMPTTVFISEDGSIVLVHGGVMSEDQLISTIETELLG